MRTLDQRLDVIADGAAVVAVEALVLRPAEVLTAERAAVHEVDLLVLVLPDVADRDVTGRAVEREAPRVAQPNGQHRGSATRGVEAEDLPKQSGRVLRVAERVAAATAVTGAHVQAPVRAELKLAAVVVRIRAVLDPHQLATCGELLDVDVAVAA